MKTRLTTFLILCAVIFACACAAAAPTSEPPVDIVEVQEATATTPPPTPTPTPNPYLVDASLQPFSATIFGNGFIRKLFLTQDQQTLLIQTDLGIHLFDTNTWQQLAFAQPGYDVIAFDGERGYLHKHTSVRGSFTDNVSITYKNLVPFSWDGSELHFDTPQSFLGMEGEEVDILEFSANPSTGLIFGASEYQRGANGIRIIPSPRQYYLWDDPNGTPLSMVNTKNHRDGLLSPDGQYLALYTFTVGSPSKSVLSLVTISEDGVTSPKTLATFTDSIRNMAFSPDSSKVLASNWDEEVFVYDIEQGSKQTYSLSTDDFIQYDDRSCGIGEAIFVDSNTVAIGSDQGKLILWDLLNDSSQSYAISDGSIPFLRKFDDRTILVVTAGEIVLFDMTSGQTTTVLDMFESSLSSNIRVNDGQLIKFSHVFGNKIHVDQWDLNTITKHESLAFSYPLADARLSLSIHDIMKDRAVLGVYAIKEETPPMLLVDMENLTVLDENLENQAIDPGENILYSPALDQYIGVGLNGYELVFASADDPLFKEPVSRKGTLRSIRDFSLSADGSLAYILEDGMLQVLGLVDPSESRTLSDRKLSGTNIFAMDETRLLLIEWTYKSSKFTMFDLSTETFSALDIPDNGRVTNIEQGAPYPDGAIAISYENWGVAIYNVLTNRMVKSYRVNEDGSGLEWNYTLFPKEQVIIGYDSGGFYKKVDVVYTLQ